MSIIKRMFGLGRDKTREELISDIARQAKQEFMMILDETRPGDRPATFRIDVELNPKSVGPELQALHQDLRDGRADDLYAAFRESKTTSVQSILPIRRNDGKFEFRVVFDARNPAERDPTPEP